MVPGGCCCHGCHGYPHTCFASHTKPPNPSHITKSSCIGDEFKGAIHSTKISGNFGPKLSGSVRSNRKSFEKTGPPFEVVLFSRSDRLELWLNGSRPKYKVTNQMYLFRKRDAQVLS